MTVNETNDRILRVYGLIGEEPNKTDKSVILCEYRGNIEQFYKIVWRIEEIPDERRKEVSD